MKRRTFVAASAVALALPALGRAQSDQVLKFIPNSDLAVLDPVWSTAYVTRNHGYLVFDTLYGQTGLEGGYVATPQMVAGHSIEDEGRTWRLTLRNGLLFHDGERVLARDCVASIRRWGARDSLGQTLLARTDELSAPDDKTIQFRLKRPFALLPEALGKAAVNMCAIMPERLASTDPYKQVTEMVGSGPYRFKANERVQGARFVYERFPGYTPREGGGRPEWTTGPKVAHFERIEWHIIPDPATAAAALQSGEVDGWERPTGDLLQLLARDRKLKLELVYEMGACMLLRPNHLFPPFDNPGVRRALFHAIDQTEVMIAVMGADPALRKVPCGFFPPGSPMASDTGMAALTEERDYDRVKRDLQAAGYKGEKVAFLVPQDYPIIKAASDVAADMMKRAGMEVEYQALDWGTVTQRRANRNPPSQGGWNAFCTTLSGDEFATPAAHHPLRGTGGQAWFGWPTSPRIEALRDEWLDATDLPAQKRIAAEIQAQAFQDVPYLPLGLFYNPSAYRADLTGILHGFPIFWNLRRA
ncbi:MAG: ABC transporter substrate-binding protein [Acetobacteraceae bacterium]|nr:ABC transporter substrate-binding protein [Acetobacteraceae bacterium]